MSLFIPDPFPDAPEPTAALPLPLRRPPFP